MSKRERAAAKQSASTRKPVEIITLLDDSSEDDPDDVAVQARTTTHPTGPAARPTKRLRRSTEALPPQPNRSTDAGASDAPISQLPRRRGAIEDPPPAPTQAPRRSSQRPSRLRQATLPVASLRPRAAALPLQMLNPTRAKIAAAPCITISGDSTAGSPTPSASRSRLSQDPDYTTTASQGASQGPIPPASQTQSRPQLRQLTLAPSRGSSASASGGGGGGAPRSATTTTITNNNNNNNNNNTNNNNAAGALSELWHERHAPQCEEDLLLALHRKKVTEVRDWLEAQRHILLQLASSRQGAVETTSAAGRGTAAHASGGASQAASLQASQQPRYSTQPQQTQQLPYSSSWGPVGATWQSQQQHPQQLPQARPRCCGVAVLSGPAGCGKSACLRVLAEAVGFEVVEWTPPPPLMWSEYQYQRAAGGGSGGGGEYGNGGGPSYQSKLDDFEAFVNRSKYPALALKSAASAAAASVERSHGAAPAKVSGPSASQHPAPAAAGSSSAPGADVGGTGSASPRPKLLLLEDLPHAHDAERRQRLAGALRDLAASARSPVVVVATEAEGQAGGGGDGGGGGGRSDAGGMGGAKGLHKDILAVLQSAGALTIAFNPVTANNITKLLLRVAEMEGVTLPPPTAVGLAEAADGDLRSALQALQMHAMLERSSAGGGGGGGEGGRGGGGKKRGGGGSRKGGGGGGVSVTAALRSGRAAALGPGEVSRLAAAQRDLGLPLFHALGKFLHNKRGQAGQGGDGEGGEGSDQEREVEGERGGRGAGGRGGGGGGGSKAEKDSVALRQLNAHALAAGRQWALGHRVELPSRLQRPPMRYDPEAVLLRCGLEAPSLLSFLAENYLGFVALEGEEAMEDVATVATYFSDSAVLCGQSRSATAATAIGGTSLWLEDSPAAANIAAAIAASVAARGLMYGNTRPAAARFNPIRAPAVNAIDTAAAANCHQLHESSCRLAEVAAAGGGGTASVFSGASAGQLVAGVVPWLRSLAQTSPGHAAWLAGALPGRWSYYWNGGVTEGAFLRRVATLPRPMPPPPPPAQYQQQQWAGQQRWGQQQQQHWGQGWGSQQPPQQQQQQLQWGGGQVSALGRGGSGGSGSGGGGGWNGGSSGGVEGMMQDLGLGGGGGEEEEDPIEDLW